LSFNNLIDFAVVNQRAGMNRAAPHKPHKQKQDSEIVCAWAPPLFHIPYEILFRQCCAVCCQSAWKSESLSALGIDLPARLLRAQHEVIFFLSLPPAYKGLRTQGPSSRLAS
jgi:hypothetical protein